MRQEWEPEELVASWTLLDADWALVANKAGATRLGFAYRRLRGLRGRSSVADGLRGLVAAV